MDLNIDRKAMKKSMKKKSSFFKNIAKDPEFKNFAKDITTQVATNVINEQLNMPPSPTPQSPTPQMPVQQIPIQQMPVQQMPVQQMPVQQMPVQQSPQYNVSNFIAQPNFNSQNIGSDFRRDIVEIHKKLDYIISRIG